MFYYNKNSLRSSYWGVGPYRYLTGILQVNGTSSTNFLYPKTFGLNAKKLNKRSNVDVMIKRRLAGKKAKIWYAGELLLHTVDK
jgi:hypothetical protein